MKKLISLILAILLITTLCFSTSATNETDYTYNFGEKTIVFNSSTTFTKAQREKIANILNGTGNETEVANLLCIFGHNYNVDHVTTITHCASATAPRCLEEIYEVSVCTRCNQTITEKITSSYIYCCP